MEKIRSRAPESKEKEDTRRMLDNYYRSLSYAVWHTPSSQLLPCFLLTIIMTLTDENDVRNFFLCQKYLPHSFYLSGSMSTVIYLFLFFNIRWLFSFSEIVFFFLRYFLCFISKSETVHFSRLQKTRSHHRNHVTWKKRRGKGVTSSLKNERQYQMKMTRTGKKPCRPKLSFLSLPFFLYRLVLKKGFRIIFVPSFSATMQSKLLPFFFSSFDSTTRMAG